MDLVNGKDFRELLFQKLIDAIDKNSDVTIDQNKKLVRYTRCLFWLTIVITVIAVLQLIIMLK